MPWYELRQRGGVISEIDGVGAHIVGAVGIACEWAAIVYSRFPTHLLQPGDLVLALAVELLTQLLPLFDIESHRGLKGFVGALDRVENVARKRLG